MIYASMLVLLSLVQVVYSDCNKGYEQYGNKCYKVSGVLDFTIFVTAASLCQKDGGDLASITNAFEDSFVIQLAEKSGAVDYWIGLRCPRGNATACYWIDATPFSYSDFYFGNPSVVGDCCAVSLDPLSHAQGKWYTSACLVEMRYVCQQTAFVRPATKKRSLETSTDGLSNDTSLILASMHPKNIIKYA